jgi:hypothetical protein
MLSLYLCTINTLTTKTKVMRVLVRGSVRLLGYGRGSRHQQYWRQHQQRFSQLSPFTKGALGGLAVGLLVFPLSNVLILGGMCYAAYAFIRRRAARRQMDMLRESMSPFSRMPFNISPFAGMGMGGAMHQFIKIMFPALKNLANVEQMLKEQAEIRIVENSVLRERLGNIEAIEGPISQQLVQTNDSMKLRVAYEVVGSRNRGIVGLDAKLVGPISTSSMQQRIQLKNMTLNINGRVENIPLDEKHKRQDEGEVIIDAEVVDVKSTSSDNFKKN